MVKYFIRLVVYLIKLFLCIKNCGQDSIHIIIFLLCPYTFNISHLNYNNLIIEALGNLFIHEICSLEITYFF